MAPVDPTFRAAPLDGLAKLAIAGAGGVMLALLWWLFSNAAEAAGPLWTRPSLWLGIALLALLAPAVLGDLLRAPTGYTFDGTNLRIHRRHAKDVRFAVTGEVERFTTATDLRRRGIFYGCRWVPEGNKKALRNPFKESGPSVYVAATDLTRAVRVDIPGGTAIITPADPDAFIDAAS